MAKESKSVLDAIKNEINKSNNGAFKNFFKIRESGAKVRVRFLENFEDCTQIVFHDKWNGFNHPCLEQYGKDCPNCDNPEARTNTLYCWNVYNYESKQVELFLYKANKATPIFSLMSLYEVVGDITQQDIVVQRNGTGTGTTYQCTAVPKTSKFDKSVKLFSEKKILALCLEAFNKITDESDGDDDDDDEEETVNTKRNTKSSSKKKSKSAPVDDDDDDDVDDDDEDFDDDDDEEEEEEAPKKKTATKKKAKPVEEDEDEDDEPPFDEDEDEEEELPPPRK